MFIDVLRRRLEIGEGSSTKVIGLDDRGTLLHIPANSFIPRGFVLRCKVIQCTRPAC